MIAPAMQRPVVTKDERRMMKRRTLIAKMVVLERVTVYVVEFERECLGGREATGSGG